MRTTEKGNKRILAPESRLVGITRIWETENIGLIEWRNLIIASSLKPPLVEGNIAVDLLFFSFKSW
jgi:hypothetical protein